MHTTQRTESALAPLTSGRRLAEVTLLWGLPTVGLALAAWAWGALGVSGALLLYLLLVPALTAYLVVIVGAGWLGYWRFPLPYAVRGVPPQIGLIYSGTYSLAFTAVAALVTPQTLLLNPLVGPLLGTITGALVGTAYDLVATHYRLLDPPLRMRHPGAGTWQTVRRYSFVFFGGMGLVNVVAFQVGARLLAGDVKPATLIALIIGASVLAALPFLASLLRTRHRQRRRHRQSTG